MTDTTWTGTLTDEQREHFITRGYVVIENAFDGEDAKKWVRDECLRAGFDTDDQTTWNKPYVRVSTERKESLPDYAPAVWEATCALMGGASRVRGIPHIGLMAVNLFQDADRPFEAASPASPGWHKDGWHFRHFLDSWEQGLLGIPLLTDVVPQGGATFIAAGSVGPVARFLAAHPEGVLPDGFPVRELIEGCEFIEATGNAGDFYLCHPYLIHAVSQNTMRRARAISNIDHQLNSPMQFDREDGDYSPVEAAILHGLGVERYPFTIKGERYVTPDGGPMIASWR